MTSKNIMVVGVGGQGTLLTSRILRRLVIGTGFGVKLSEVHGMVQRGGSMVTFVRYGGEMVEPIVEEGQVDVLIAFERLGALRYLRLLKKDGVAIVDDWRINPIAMVTGVAQYPEGIVDQLKEVRRTIMVEVMEEAKKMGVPKAFSVVVLGATAKYMGFEEKDWLKVIETVVPSKTMEINKEAFETGYVLSI